MQLITNIKTKINEFKEVQVQEFRANQHRIITYLFIAVLGFATGQITPSYFNTITITETIKEPIIQTVKAETIKPILSVEEQIRAIAEEENFQWIDYLVNLAHCESRLDPLATNGQNNNPSYSVDRGLFQINNYWHKEVSDEQAYDLDYSTRWTIERINSGYQTEWVCDRYIK